MRPTFSIWTQRALAQTAAPTLHSGMQGFTGNTNETEFLMNITCEYRRTIESLRDLDDRIFDEWEMTRETSLTS
jgi:hypothetical protein